MATTLADSWTKETDGLWLAGSSVYPRITVAAENQDAAIKLLDERRKWWLNLPPADE